MGYEVYELGDRFAGYGVPSICEHPDCNEEIDRGVAYACGGEPRAEHSCDRYFCSDHRDCAEVELDSGKVIEVRDLCERCAKLEPPFDYKPEKQKWIDYLLTDESWSQWRDNNPEKVKSLQDKK